MASRFVVSKINPILGQCFHEGAGRVQYAGSTELPTPGIDFLHARTEDVINAILALVRSMRELKGSRNFPGEDPSPDYDRGIEECIHAIEEELGRSESSDDYANERAAWLDEKKANDQ